MFGVFERRRYHGPDPVSGSHTGQISGACPCPARTQAHVDHSHQDLDGLQRIIATPQIACSLA